MAEEKKNTKEGTSRKKSRPIPRGARASSSPQLGYRSSFLLCFCKFFHYSFSRFPFTLGELSEDIVSYCAVSITSRKAGEDCVRADFARSNSFYVAVGSQLCAKSWDACLTGKARPKARVDTEQAPPPPLPSLPRLRSHVRGGLCMVDPSCSPLMLVFSVYPCLCFMFFSSVLCLQLTFFLSDRVGNVCSAVYVLP